MDLNTFRNKIDGIDDNIVKLLMERFAVVKELSEYKKAHGLDVFQQAREAEILKKIADKIDNEEYKDYILKIYTEIFGASKSLQRNSNSSPS